MGMYHALSCDECGIHESVAVAFPEWDMEGCPLDGTAVLGEAVTDLDIKYKSERWVVTVYDESFCSAACRDRHWATRNRFAV
jgi:hypothetical protein